MVTRDKSIFQSLFVSGKVHSNKTRRNKNNKKQQEDKDKICAFLDITAK